MLFPALRRSNPALNPVVDKLEADHRAVSHQLDEIEAAAKALGLRAGPEARRRVVEALNALATDLLAHLEFEEENVSPTLRTWTRWPFFAEP
jgi:iron-sulfur cluster repair protein YtfE (RIC family)